MDRHTIFDAAHVFQQLATVANGKIGLWVRVPKEYDLLIGVELEAGEAKSFAFPPDCNYSDLFNWLGDYQEYCILAIPEVRISLYTLNICDLSAFTLLNGKMTDRYSASALIAQYLISILFDTPMAFTWNIQYKGYVYLLKYKHSVYKIGRAKNPKRRFKDLKNQASDFQVIKQIPCIDEPSKLERMLHRKYKEYRIYQTEIFMLPKEAVTEICNISI